MEKIQTLFERDMENGGKITNQYSPRIDPQEWDQRSQWVATEKVDGTNIRVTLRNGVVVRVEKRRNPDKIQKAKGIIEPWYVDADEYAPEDKWIFDAVRNTDMSRYPLNGEFSGEAVGKNIQGNPLNLERNQVCFFTLGDAPTFEDVPFGFDELKAWLPTQKSKYGNDCGIEGIVWHYLGEPVAKIKVKDFR